jgi:hypothetical protein
MFCQACDAEMALMKVVADDRLGVRGFEHHSFECSVCKDVKRQRVFMRYGRESEPDPMPIIPNRVLQQLHQCRVSAVPGLFRRLIAKVSGRQFVRARENRAAQATISLP